jgi:hypothetical protein
MATLSQANKDALQAAIDRLIKENAVEIPFDAEIIERVARVAASTGFQGAGNFKENAKLRPISVLLQFIKFIGT